MRIPSSVVALVAVVVLASASPSFSQVSGDLSSWSGKDPDARGSGPSFWSQPAVARGMAATLGKARTDTFLRSYQVTSGSFEPVGRTLSFGACKPHDCFSNKGVVYVDVRDGSVEACWQSPDPHGRGHDVDLWLTPGHSRVLPEGSCQQAWLEPAKAYPALSAR